MNVPSALDELAVSALGADDRIHVHLRSSDVTQQQNDKHSVPTVTDTPKRYCSHRKLRVNESMSGTRAVRVSVLHIEMPRITIHAPLIALHGEVTILEISGRRRRAAVRKGPPRDRRPIVGTGDRKGSGRRSEIDPQHGLGQPKSLQHCRGRASPATAATGGLSTGAALVPRDLCFA